MRHRGLRFAAVFAGICLIAAACGGSEGEVNPPTTAATTTPAPSTTVAAPTTTTTVATTTTLDPTLDAPAGFTRHVDVEYGFVMDIPEGWVTIGTDPEMLDEMLAAGGDAAGVDPALLELAAAQLDGGVALILFDPTNEGANINFLDAGPSTGLSARLYANLMPGFMEEFGAVGIETEVLELPAGSAVKALYDTPALGSRGLQYSIFADGGLWILTLSADDVAPYGDLIAHMAASFATG
jgi:hypothetical protein